MSESLVSLTRQGPVAVVSLNRPARHNALVPELLQSLIGTLKDDRCLSASALVLCAQGRSFSTGGDLLGFQQHRSTIREYADKIVGLLNQAIVALYKHPVPVVCAVQGQVTGGSLGFLLASDWVVMHRSATITPWYAEVGLSPDGGWTAILPDIIGRQQCMHWLSSNASYDALTCHRLGLVQQIVDGDCAAAAFEWVDDVQTKQPGSINCIRHLLTCNNNEIETKLDNERKVFVEQIQTPEALHGIDLFLKRNSTCTKIY